MTTKPKAKKFRIKRSAGTGPAANTAPPPAAAPDVPVDPQNFGANTPIGEKPSEPQAPTPPLREGDVASAQQVAGETDIDAIRREGLTGRQLRMARRQAQKHGLAVTSDFDAVRQLRERGINPFQRVNMLELVVPEGQKEAEAPSKLPQTVPAGEANVPSTDTASPMQRRVREVAEIQRDIARRRRQKSLMLVTRLLFFVLLPTFICGFYFYFVATPMYATKSAFLILKAESGPSSATSLLSGTQFATATDAISVQDYLTSKDAMIRLDEDSGFASHFAQDWIDPIQRLSPHASNEVAHKLYQKNVKIGFDPTEGVIRMEVRAADPAVSAQFSERLITYAEERVDSLSQRKRENQVRDAERNLVEAEQARREAQERLVRLQLENDLIDPEGEITSLRTQINTFETQLREKEIELAALLDNSRPNRAKVDGTQGDIRRLEDTLSRLRNEMTQVNSDGRSLAELASRVQLAQADVATRDLMLTAALEQLNQTRRDANSQVRYLTTSVEPVAPQDPSYPRKFENTMLSLLIFSGIYLMLSLTASILREQVTA
ncbi:capsule biosynthesis protein [Primorskyibacter sp. S187A]|uniref:capsule biosynthesis protein n=1 Tax=Primorskyibacter sp. S187A TaxID=3415130 RepID=UPI003C7BDCA5